MNAKSVEFFGNILRWLLYMLKSQRPTAKIFFSHLTNSELLISCQLVTAKIMSLQNSKISSCHEKA